MRINWKKGKIECCGLHEVCERNLPEYSEGQRRTPCMIEYYDDEELDAYAGRAADSYSEDEILQFRDVRNTMLEQDVSGWEKSLKERNISLPTNF